LVIVFEEVIMAEEYSECPACGKTPSSSGMWFQVIDV
jgi:hypothetical protein